MLKRLAISPNSKTEKIIIIWCYGGNLQLVVTGLTELHGTPNEVVVTANPSSN